jgi:hypothetical protein
VSIEIKMTDAQGQVYASKIELPKTIDFDQAKSLVEAHWGGLAGDLRRCDGYEA